MKSRKKLRLKKQKKKSHSKENKMTFIYYVLILMLTYIGPAYAEFDIIEENAGEVEQSIPDRNKVADDLELHAQNDIVVGELPSGKIKIYTDMTHSTTIEVDKQDCSIMRKKDDSLALGFKFGGLMWGFGPEIKIGHSSGVEWKSDVQRMVAEYQELCTQFNTGRLSQQEYQQEKADIIKRGYAYAQELEKRFKQKKDDMFKEMDDGKYIHLQNTRFYEGCCYYNNKSEEAVVAVEPNRYYNDYDDGGLAILNTPLHSAGNQWFAERRAIAKLYDRQNERVMFHSRMKSMRRNNGVRWNVYGNSNGNWNIGIGGW